MNNIINDLNNDLNNDIKNDLSNNMSNDMRNDMSNDMSNDMRNDMSNDMNNDIINDMSNHMINDMSNHMINDMSNHMINDLNYDVDISYLDSKMYLSNDFILTSYNENKDNRYRYFKELLDKNQFLYFYEIEIVSSIIENNFMIYKYNIINLPNDINKEEIYKIFLKENNEDNNEEIKEEIKEENKIFFDIGQILFDNMIKLLIIYINTNNLDILFPSNIIVKYLKINNFTDKYIVDLVLNYFKNDINNLLNFGYDINRLNNLYLINTINLFKYNNEKVSLLGYFVYNFVQYINEIHNELKYFLIGDIFSNIYIYLLEKNSNPNMINYFPDNNNMSISAYILLSMIKLNNRRLELLQDKNININNAKLRNKYMNEELLCNNNFLNINKKTKILNTTIMDRTKKINRNITSMSSKDLKILLKLSNNIIRINKDIKKVKIGLSLLTWMFDVLMNYESTLSSPVLNISINNFNTENTINLSKSSVDKELSSDIITKENKDELNNITCLYDLIHSNIIIKECKNHILNKYKNIIDNYKK